MAAIPIKWHLQRSSHTQGPLNLYTSSYKLNEEWNLVCWWSQYEFAPEILEIRRTSTLNDILVTANIELSLDSKCLFKRNVNEVIKSGVAFIEIKLGNSSNSSISNNYLFYRLINYTITGSLKISTEQKRVKGVEMESLLNVSTNFECLLDPKTSYFSDVNLNCEAVSFSAHKCILSARSPVFAAMFANQMKENLDNKVDIKDISPHILKTMLTYLYTGKTGDLTVQSAGELLFAADMYQLKDLKRVCSEYLKSCMSFQNVLNILVLGDLHDQDLKVFSLNFICNMFEEFEILEKTPEWTTLREKRSDLAMDVLASLVKSKDKKLKGKIY